MNETKIYLLKNGVKSGLIAGTLAAFLFGLALAGYFAWDARTLLGFVIAPNIFAFVIPVGMVSGSLLWLSIGYIIYKKNTYIQHIRAIGVITGMVTGSVYPIWFLLVVFLTEGARGNSNLPEAIFSLISGVICGGIGGLWGSKRFRARAKENPFNDG